MEIKKEWISPEVKEIEVNASANTGGDLEGKS